MANTDLSLGGGFGSANGSGFQRQTVFPFRKPFPNRIAGEYDRGNFVVYHSFSPATISVQKRYLMDEELNNEVKFAAGSYIPLFYIPQIHTIYDVVLKTEASQIGDRGDRYIDNTAGMTINVVLNKLELDSSKLGYKVLETIKVDELQGQVVSDNVVKRAVLEPGKGLFTEKGQGLQLGFEIASMPNDEKVSLPNVSARITLVGVVNGYDNNVQL